MGKNRARSDRAVIGYGEPGYDIGTLGGERILAKRRDLGGRFTQVEELSGIRGFGKDKFRDLVGRMSHHLAISIVLSFLSTFAYAVGECEGLPLARDAGSIVGVYAYTPFRPYPGPANGTVVYLEHGAIKMPRDEIIQATVVAGSSGGISPGRGACIHLPTREESIDRNIEGQLAGYDFFIHLSLPAELGQLGGCPVDTTPLYCNNPFPKLDFQINRVNRVDPMTGTPYCETFTDIYFVCLTDLDI